MNAFTKMQLKELREQLQQERLEHELRRRLALKRIHELREQLRQKQQKELAQ